jgi:SAM-dependent methyltransferase
VGVDISRAAIGRASARSDARTKFVCANALEYTPASAFDVIVFNEILYYFSDPLGAVQKYAQYLKPHGVLIVSLFLTPHNNAIWKRLKRTYRLAAEAKIVVNSTTHVCSVFLPQSTKPTTTYAHSLSPVDTSRNDEVAGGPTSVEPEPAPHRNYQQSPLMASSERSFSATVIAGRLHLLGLASGRPWNPARLEWRAEPELDSLVNIKRGDRKVRTQEELETIVATSSVPPRFLWIHENLAEAARRLWERTT